MSGGHLCEWNEQKRCLSRKVSNASPRPTLLDFVLVWILRTIRESPLRNNPSVIFAENDSSPFRGAEKKRYCENIYKKYCEPKDTQYCEKINNFQIITPPPTTVSPS